MKKSQRLFCRCQKCFFFIHLKIHIWLTRVLHMFIFTTHRCVWMSEWMYLCRNSRGKTKCYLHPWDNVSVDVIMNRASFREEWAVPSHQVPSLGERTVEQSAASPPRSTALPGWLPLLPPSSVCTCAWTRGSSANGWHWPALAPGWLAYFWCSFSLLPSSSPIPRQLPLSPSLACPARQGMMWAPPRGSDWRQWRTCSGCRPVAFSHSCCSPGCSTGTSRETEGSDLETCSRCWASRMSQRRLVTAPSQSPPEKRDPHCEQDNVKAVDMAAW